MDHSSLWHSLLEGTRELRGPLLLKESFGTDFFSLDDVREILRGMSAEKGPLPQKSLRVYVHDGSNVMYEDKVLHTPPDSAEQIDLWSERVFGQEKYGIVINRAERWNEPLAQRVAQFLLPFVEQTGMPLGGVEITLFIGNYGYTPFGVHFDGGLTHVIHFHVGPGSKTMYIWSEAEFESLTGSRRPYFNPEKIISRGEAFVIEKRDVFFLPADTFHVGRTDGFSVGMALAIGEENSTLLARKAMIAKIDQILTNHTPKRLSRICNATVNNTSLGFDEAPDLSREKPTETFGDWYRQAVREYAFCLMSNLGLSTSPARVDGRGDASSFRFIRGRKPFRIIYDQLSPDRVAFYVRGTRIELKYHPALIQVVNKLNSGELVSTLEIGRLLSDTWSEKAIGDLLNVLYFYHGILDDQGP